MGVKVQGLDGLVSFLQREADKRVNLFLDRLNYIGMEAVTYIRDRSSAESWEDQTGNLRSSIGYIVTNDGKVIKESGFERVDGPKRAEAKVDGSVEGKAYAEQLAAQYPTGYALIVVAGMNYAVYVERMDSKDVLEGGKKFLKTKIKQLAAEYKQTYGR